MSEKTFTKPAPEIDGAALTVLTQHRGGELMNDLSAAFREVNGQVNLVGKPGTVTVVFKISPARGVQGALVLSDDLSTKAPRVASRASIFYADAQNNLVRNDPNQHELPLKILDTKTELPPLKHVVAA